MAQLTKQHARLGRLFLEAQGIDGENLNDREAALLGSVGGEQQEALGDLFLQLAYARSAGNESAIYLIRTGPPTQHDPNYWDGDD